MSINHLLVLMPVFNDWSACRRLLVAVDQSLSAAGVLGQVLLVNDGSVATVTDDFITQDLEAIECVQVLELKRNLGHQRAICVALGWASENWHGDAVLVMDADGEDDPADIPRLIAALDAETPQRIIFAERTRRSENLSFRIGYWCYRQVHRCLTGHRVRVGNYSLVPVGMLESLVVIPELWSHYAAAIYKSGLPYSTIPTTRARRLDGRSSMNLVGLVTHGLTAMSVFGEIIGTRMLLIAVGLFAATLTAMVGAVAAGCILPWMIPGWVAIGVGLLASIAMQAVLLATAFSFVILGSRNASTFLPARDYYHFVRTCRKLVSRNDKYAITP
jgi:hypothetical protein